MVPDLDNDTINTRSQLHNDKISPGEALIQILMNHEETIHRIKSEQIDVNNFGDDPASGIVTVQNPQRSPLLITDIYATWNPAGQVTSTGGNQTGTNYFYTNTSGQNQTLDSVNAVLTTSATVANRTIGIQVNDASAHTIFAVNDLTPIAASSTVTLNAYVGATQQNAASGNVVLPLPPNIIIPPNGTVEILVGNIQAGDTITGISQTVIQSGVATITFGGRTLQLQYAQGFFSLAGMTHGLQLDNTAKGNSMVLTVLPPTAVHLEFSGTADFRKVERF